MQQSYTPLLIHIAGNLSFKQVPPPQSSLSGLSYENLFLFILASTLRNLKNVYNTNSDFNILLCAQEAVDDEVDRTVDNEEEVLDGSEAEHPAGVGGEHAQAPAQVGPLTYS